MLKGDNTNVNSSKGNSYYIINLKRLDKNYILCYLLTIIFFMRWQIYYAKSATELLLVQLPYQLLCLVLGVGLEYVIYAIISVEYNTRRKIIVCGAYFSILYCTLISTGILWIRATRIEDLVFTTVTIGMLRIIQKNRFGIFFEGNRKYVLKALFVIFAFFITIDVAYEPYPSERTATAISTPGVGEDTAWKENETILLGLKPDNWKQLNLDERLNLMKTVTNIEVNHLGLSLGIPVKTKGLGKDTNAAYSNRQNIIYINEKRLQYASSKEMLTSITHETYHAYQARIVDTYNLANKEQKQLLHFRILKRYKDEMNNYTSGEADYEKYYSQTMEHDARAYGKERTAYYWKKLKLK